jgi:hypothetical protein
MLKLGFLLVSNNLTNCSGEDEAVEGDFQEFQDYDEF